EISWAAESVRSISGREFGGGLVRRLIRMMAPARNLTLKFKKLAINAYHDQLHIFAISDWPTTSIVKRFPSALNHISEIRLASDAGIQLERRCFGVQGAYSPIAGLFRRGT